MCPIARADARPSSASARVGGGHGGHGRGPRGGDELALEGAAAVGGGVAGTGVTAARCIGSEGGADAGAVCGWVGAEVTQVSEEAAIPRPSPSP